MFEFLFKSGTVTPDLSFIGADMHSHLLPGIDDGLQDIEDSVEFIKQLKELGYQKLIFTPHILSDLYPNNRETILPKLDLVRKALKKEKVDMPVDAAAEYMIDHSFAELIGTYKKSRLLLIQNQYILVEMSYLAASPNFEQVIFDLRMLGLIPILAHPERYSYYHQQFETYQRFVDLGCKLQVNLLSLSGVYGSGVRKTAEKLFKHHLVDFLGTDMHHEKHLSTLHSLAAKKEFYNMVSGATLLNRQLI